MIFVGLPALQRSQRDEHRKRNVQVVAAALESYKSNNKGNYPWSNKSATTNDRFLRLTNQDSQDFFNNYVNREGNISDPSGGEYDFFMTAYNLKYNPTGAGGWASGLPNRLNFIYVTGNAKCVPGRWFTSVEPADRPSYVIQYKLENGGNQCTEFN